MSPSLEEKTGFDFDRLYYFKISDVEKIIEAENYDNYIKNRFNNDQLIYDGLEEFEKYDNEDHWGKNELIGWYSDNEYCPEYFIADPDKIEEILNDSFIIYDSEGGPYHFHDIQDELGEICAGHCTHMG